MELRLRYYGDPILRKRAKEVEEITPEVRALGEAMLKNTREKDNWVGIAAPQIGELLRIFVIKPYLPGKDGELYLGDVQIYINPKLSNPSEETCIDSEGCLSIPKLYAAVERPIGVTVEAMDLDGNFFTQELEGYVARQIMHENDHLNGVLFPDRLPPRVRKEVEDRLRQIKKEFYRP